MSWQLFVPIFVGLRLEKPAACPDELFQLLFQSWRVKASRPVSRVLCACVCVCVCVCVRVISEEVLIV